MAGDGVQEDVIKLKLWDKPAALLLLFKHLNLMEDRLHITIDHEFTARLEAARDRVQDVKARKALKA